MGAHQAVDGVHRAGVGLDRTLHSFGGINSQVRDIR